MRLSCTRYYIELTFQVCTLPVSLCKNMYMYTSIPVYTVSVPLIAGQNFRPQIGNEVEPLK